MSVVALGVGFFFAHSNTWAANSAPACTDTVISTNVTVSQSNVSALCSFTVNSGISISVSTVGSSTTAAGVSNTGAGTITTLNNAGSISATGGMDGLAVAINNTGTITTLNNTGLISTNGDSATGIWNIGGTITTLNNTGSISVNFIGSTGGHIYNTQNGTIGTLNNLQGKSGNNPLRINGTLPRNYNIIVASSTNYGQLLRFGAVGGMAFGISDQSTASSLFVGQTLAGVLQGFGKLQSYITSGLTSSNGYTYLFVQQGSTGTWDLTITACALCAGGGSSGSGGSTTSNITAGTSVDLSSLGVTASPVLAGGTLVLSRGDSSSVSIAITSAGGTIQAPSSGSAILSGVFSGSGGLTFTSGAGIAAGGTAPTVVLSGANTYSGGTTVSGGTLVVAGPSPTGTGDVFVASAGTLMGTGTIAGNSMVSGVLKPGNSPGYLSFTQNLTLNAGSTYQQDIAGSTQASSTTPVGASGYYSFVNVGSQLTITSGATLTPRLSNLFAANEVGYGSTPYTPVLGDRFRIITASGGISGKFSTLTQPAELAAGTQFVPFYNMANSNSLDLAVIPTSYQTTISAASGNKNAQSVAGALDKMVVALQNGTSSAAQDQLLYATSANNAASLSGYTQGLSGEVYPATVAVIAQTTQRVQQAVQNRLGDTMGLSAPSSMTNPAGNTALMGATNTILNGGVASSAVSTNPNVNPDAEAKSFANGNVWGELAYQNGQRSSDNYSGGWTSNLYQLVFGSDFISANGMKLGGGLALSSTTLKPSYGSATIQQGSVFAYGKMPIAEFVVDAMASLGLNSSDISRNDVTGLGNGFRNKSVSGNDAMISLGVSRPFDVDNFRVTPFARVTWQMVSQSGVNEGDIASALSVNRYTGNGVRGMLGVAAGSKATNPMTEQYTYRVYVGVGADSSGLLNPIMTASLAGLSTTINTPNAGTTFVQAGLYGTAKFADNAYAYAGLSGEARSNQTLGTVNVGLRFQF
jgi:uncharacterized protein with beta-barrel porin domain